MEFLEAKEIMKQKMGDWKIMALASCEDNYPMVRNVSCLFYNDKIYFKTDKNFRKTQQLFKNNRVAMCFNGTQVEGIAVNKGLVVDEPGRVFEKKYKEYLWQSYNAYSHVDSEILIEVTPEPSVEITTVPFSSVLYVSTPNSSSNFNWNDSDAPEEDLEYERQYECLQYNELIDKKDRDDSFFTISGEKDEE